MKKRKINFVKIINLSLFFVLASLLILVKFSLNIENSYLKDISLLEYILIKKKLLNNIFSNNPEIIKIKNEINLLSRKITLKITKEKPVAKICYKNNCYFLGEHGYIYSNNKREQEYSLLLPINSELPVLPNTSLEKNITEALAKIFEYTNLKNIYLTNIKILANKDLIFFTEKYYFLLDSNRNIKEQIKKLNYFLSNYPDQYQKIDLRIPNKIYFK